MGPSLNSCPALRPACGRGLCSCSRRYSFPHVYPTAACPERSRRIGHADAHALPASYGRTCSNRHTYSYPYAYPNTYRYADLYPYCCSHRHTCSYLYSHTCSAHCYAGTCTASLCPCPPARPGIRHPG